MTSDAEFTYSYDSLGRAIRRQNKPLGSSSAAIINESYGYLKGASNSATSLIERIGTTGIKKEDEAGNLVNTDLSYKYDYDANGNITKIYQTVNGEDILRQSYEYDAQNQLTRENNAVLNKTVIYRYTSGGNILAKIEYPYTTASEITSEPTNTISYAYGDSNWKDKLTAYNGQSIAYDEIGNPLTYGDLSFTWEKGRRLSQITDGENTYSYTYNADGIRTSKTVNGVRIDYVLEGDRIVYQKYSTGEEIWYNYDAAGKLLGFHRRTVEGLTGNYYYIRNGQGDILGFHNQSGRVVVRYTYDAWGKVISISGSMAGTLGKMNPFRYRGYYYDEETELYYLNSRYYNPDWGRFVNSDGTVSNSVGFSLHNLFSYCENNAVNKIDSSGRGTIGIGVSANVDAGICVGVSRGLYFNSDTFVDELTNAEWDIQDSTSLGIGGADVGAGIFVQYTNADDKHMLYGKSESEGYNILMFGIEFIYFLDENGKYDSNKPDGIQLTYTPIGAGLGLHHYGTTTKQAKNFKEKTKSVSKSPKKEQKIYGPFLLQPIKPFVGPLLPKPLKPFIGPRQEIFFRGK